MLIRFSIDERPGDGHGGAGAPSRRFRGTIALEGRSTTGTAKGIVAGAVRELERKKVLERFDPADVRRLERELLGWVTSHRDALDAGRAGLFPFQIDLPAPPPPPRPDRGRGVEPPGPASPRPPPPRTPPAVARGFQDLDWREVKDD